MSLHDSTVLAEAVNSTSNVLRNDLVSVHKLDKVIEIRKRIGGGAKLNPVYGKHLHTIPVPVHNLYKIIRQMSGLSQNDAGACVGISRRAWQSREQCKTMYQLCEFIMLYDMSGMSAEEFLQMVRDKCT